MKLCTGGACLHLRADDRGKPAKVPVEPPPVLGRLIAVTKDESDEVVGYLAEPDIEILGADASRTLVAPTEAIPSTTALSVRDLAEAVDTADEPAELPVIVVTVAESTLDLDAYASLIEAAQRTGQRIQFRFKLDA